MHGLQPRLCRSFLSSSGTRGAHGGLPGSPRSLLPQRLLFTGFFVVVFFLMLWGRILFEESISQLEKKKLWMILAHSSDPET